MTRIAHISDSHGYFNKLPKNIDFILHTGDIFPDPPAGTKHKDFGKVQMGMIKKRIQEFKDWLGGKSFLYLRGNHDWMCHEEFEEYLRKQGIDAYHLHDKTIEMQNVVIHGFPYLPPINGLFATETDSKTMELKINDMVDIVNNLNQIDVIASHAGPYGILDKSNNGEHYGNPFLNDAIFSRIKKENRPDYCCFGHVHNSQSITLHQGIIISNAATRPHILEIN